MIRLHRGLPLRRRDWTLMTSEESAECRVNLGGVAVPFMETCPPLSVLEVLELEGAERPVWGDEQEGEKYPERTVRLFVCFVVDALYRDCQFMSVTNLWEVLVASDSQHAVLFGASCGLADVMVSNVDMIFGVLILAVISFMGLGCSLAGFTIN